jgi:hypothetical protein
MLAFKQGINSREKDKDAEELSIQQPAPDQGPVKNIPGNNVRSGNQHDTKNQITRYFCGFFSNDINPVKERFFGFRHSIRLSGAPVFFVWG